MFDKLIDIDEWMCFDRRLELKLVTDIVKHLNLSTHCIQGMIYMVQELRRLQGDRYKDEKKQTFGQLGS